MSRQLGSWKTAAKRTGVPFPLYAERRLRGERWCYICRSWGPIAAFPLDRATAHRADARKSVCSDCQNRQARARRGERRR
jgi:hypothetical protein